MWSSAHSQIAGCRFCGYIWLQFSISSGQSLPWSHLWSQRVGPVPGKGSEAPCAIHNSPDSLFILYASCRWRILRELHGNAHCDGELVALHPHRVFLLYGQSCRLPYSVQDGQSHKVSWFLLLIQWPSTLGDFEWDINLPQAVGCRGDNLGTETNSDPGFTICWLKSLFLEKIFIPIMFCFWNSCVNISVHVFQLEMVLTKVNKSNIKMNRRNFLWHLKLFRQVAKILPIFS